MRVHGLSPKRRGPRSSGDGRGPPTPSAPMTHTCNTDQKPAQSLVSAGQESLPVFPSERHGFLLGRGCCLIAVNEPDIGGEHRGHFQGIHTFFSFGSLWFGGGKERHPFPAVRATVALICNGRAGRVVRECGSDKPCTGRDMLRSCCRETLLEETPRG